jgi:hypothetical protein
MIGDLLILFGTWAWYWIALEEDAQDKALIVNGSERKEGPYTGVQFLKDNTPLHLGGVRGTFAVGDHSDWPTPITEPLTNLQLWEAFLLNFHGETDKDSNQVTVIRELLDLCVSGLNEDLVECIGINEVSTITWPMGTENPGPFGHLLKMPKPSTRRHPFTLQMIKLVEKLAAKLKANISFEYLEHPGIKTLIAERHQFATIEQRPDETYHIGGHSIPEPAGPYSQDEAIDHFIALIRVMVEQGFKSSSDTDLHGTVVDRSKGYTWSWQEEAAHFVRCLAEEKCMELQALTSGGCAAMVSGQFRISLWVCADGTFLIEDPAHSHSARADTRSEAMRLFQTYCKQLVHVLSSVDSGEEGRFAQKVRDIACELEDGLHLQVWIDRSPGKYRLSSDVRGERRWCEIHMIKPDLYAILPDYQTNRIEYQDRGLALLALKQKAECIFSNSNCTPKHHHNRDEELGRESPFFHRFNRLCKELSAEMDVPLKVALTRPGRVRFMQVKNRVGYKPVWVEIERGVRDWFVLTHCAQHPRTFPNEGEATSHLIKCVRHFLRQPS